MSLLSDSYTVLVHLFLHSVTLADQMKIDSLEDREKLLSSLYDVSNPTNGPKGNPKLMSKSLCFG